LALSFALDLASAELDHHLTEARRCLDLCEYHLLAAELAQERLARLERQIPEGAL
jgi:hypothetical protein